MISRFYRRAEGRVPRRSPMPLVETRAAPGALVSRRSSLETRVVGGLG